MHREITWDDPAQRICLFEDAGVDALEPLSLTRPAFDLLCGATSLGHKQCRVFGLGEVGVLVRPYLADLCRHQRPSVPVNDFDWLRSKATLLINSRWLPPPEAMAMPPVPSVAMIDDEVAYAAVETEHLRQCSWDTIDDCLRTWKSGLPKHGVGGHLIRHGWDLIEQNAEQIRHDACRLAVHTDHPGLTVLGSCEQLHIDPSARIEPFVVFDTTPGPIIVDREAVVTAFSRIEAPCYIGVGTEVHGAKIRGGVTLGPECRIGGEVEASIVHGHTNKYHDGFLGHAYVGEWVNLGAGTQNSDLRNDYGEVIVTVVGRRVATGISKAGCLIGDHTKTGLGTLINTGANIGAFCNLLPGGFVPRYMPSFTSWWKAALAPNEDVPALLETARMVMARRGATLTEAHARIYRAVFEQTDAVRRQSVREGDRRRLRRTA